VTSQLWAQELCEGIDCWALDRTGHAEQRSLAVIRDCRPLRWYVRQEAAKKRGLSDPCP
jgi:hypothetical protein